MTTFQTPAKMKKRKILDQETFNIPSSPFLEHLGHGTGVNVWKLQNSPRNGHPCSPWAIKNIRKNIEAKRSNIYQSLIKKEANILRTLNHENIIGFRGYTKSSDGRNCLAMENGGESLGDLIETRLEDDLGPFSAKTILKVALNIAKALQYLHKEKNILHGDIKSYNIVVKGDFESIKLCDFGVSFALDSNGEARGFVGTPLYSAPECLDEDSDMPVTCKADIFSLGLVLWEMMALVPPHSSFEDNYESNESSLKENSDESDLDEDIDDMSSKFGTRPPLPPIDLTPEYGPVIEIFYACTEQDPSKRPTAEYLVQYLNSL